MIRLFIILVFFSNATPAQTFSSTPNLCDQISSHTPNTDVNFKPNSDDVVPADLNPLRAAAPDKIDIPITVELAERFPALNIDPDFLLRPEVANLSIYQDGRVEYNNQDITTQIHAECGKSQSADGQTLTPSLPSKSIEGKQGIEAEALPDIIEGQYP